MRYTVFGVGMGMAAGVALLLVYAAGDDPYYGDGTSRWDHTTGSDAAMYVVGAFVVASALAVVVLAHGVVRTRFRLAPPLVLAVPLYLLALYVAWLFMSGGH